MCDNINIEFTVECKMCKAEFKISYLKHDYENWKAGMLIQDAMPYLTDDQREMMISGVCGVCFDALFASEDDEDISVGCNGSIIEEPAY